MHSIVNLNWSIAEVFYLILIFTVTFGLTYALFPYIIRKMKEKGYVGYDIHKSDRPEVAESGGLGIVIGLVVASLMVIFFFPILLYEMLIFIVTIALSAAIGFVDDRIKLRSGIKIFLVLFTGAGIFLANYLNFIHIESPTIPILGQLRLTILYPFVVPIIVAVFANTVNMLEGYNGEGSGTCLIASIFLLICGIIWNSLEGLILTLILIAVLIPFYVFNKYPAKVFPGDIGTLTIGATMACIALFGSLEVAVFCALLIHIFNSFYVLSSVRGFFESSTIQEEKNDIIMLENDLIKASPQKDAALTLPRLILARGPLKEPELVKRFYLISLICGFFSIFATLFTKWTISNLDFIFIIVVVIVFSIPTTILLYYYPRIRSVVILMISLLVIGLASLYFIEVVIMPNFTETIDIFFINIPTNLVAAFIIAAPGFLIWYLITLKHFFWQIKKISSP
ncbi:MAG: hypothetical protein R6U96_16815 [Promethearchaeia archaeon]